MDAKKQKQAPFHPQVHERILRSGPVPKVEGKLDSNVTDKVIAKPVFKTDTPLVDQSQSVNAELDNASSVLNGNLLSPGYFQSACRGAINTPLYKKVDINPFTPSKNGINSSQLEHLIADKNSYSDYQEAGPSPLSPAGQQRMVHQGSVLINPTLPTTTQAPMSDVVTSAPARNPGYIHYSNISPGITKVGEHSITLKGVVDKVCYMIPEPIEESKKVANFFAHATSLLFTYSDRINWRQANHNYEVRSLMRTPTEIDGRRPNFYASAGIATSLPPGSILNQVQIKFCESVQIGQLSLSQIAPMGAETLPNPKKFANLMKATMMLTHLQGQALEALAPVWNAALAVYDNSSIYAKLISLALHRYRLDAEGIPPVHANLNMDNIHYIRITDAPAGENPLWTVSVLEHAYSTGAIVFDWAHSFEPTLYLYYILLSMAGPHFNANATVRDVSSRAYIMPPIKVVIISKNAQPPQPTNTTWTATGMLAFARYLAHTRKEYAAYERGAYMAADISFTDAFVCGIVDEAAQQSSSTSKPRNISQVYSVVSAHFDATPPIWALPQDSNFLVRFIDQLPNVETDQTSEYIAHTSAPLPRLAMLHVLYVALTRAMSTTVMYSLNITGKALQTVFTNEYISERFESLVNASALFHRSADARGSSATKNCNFHNIVANMIQATSTMRVSLCLYRNRSFNYRMNNTVDLGGNNSFFAAVSPNAPVRIGTPLCIDDFIIWRPLEWGLSSQGPKINLKKDLKTGGPNQYGFYSFQGDNSYSNVAAVRNAYKLVLTAPAFVNNLTQAHGLRQHDITFSNSTVMSTIGVEPQWTNNDIHCPFNTPLLPGAGHPDVATIMTYDWQQNLVIAPAVIIANQRDDSVFQKLMALDGLKDIERVGYIRPILPPDMTAYADEFEGLLSFEKGCSVATQFNQSMGNPVRVAADRDIQAYNDGCIPPQDRMDPTPIPDGPNFQ